MHLLNSINPIDQFDCRLIDFEAQRANSGSHWFAPIRCVELGRKLYRVKTTIKERKNEGNTPYTYEVTKIELIEDSSVSPNKEDNGHLNRSTNSISTAKLQQYFVVYKFSQGLQKFGLY